MTLAEPPTWRPMRPGDVPAVMLLSQVVHPAFYERPEMFLDRIALYPEGCLVAEAGDARSGIAGYALAYPAPLFAPPPLDTVLGALDPAADALYVHDVAVDPAFRGRGLSDEAIGRLLALAEGFRAAMLVSVYGTAPFWERFGFRANADPRLEGKLASYGEGAVFMVRRTDLA